MTRKQESARGAVASGLMATVDGRRAEATAALDEAVRGDLGQFLTPRPVAEFMASLVTETRQVVRVLDPGAGVGSLTAAVVDHLLRLPRLPKRIYLTCYEVDAKLAAGLARTLHECVAAGERVGVSICVELRAEDFISSGLTAAGGPFGKRQEFDLAILNPPYKKLRADSEARRLLSEAGIEASNLYSAFLAISARLLVEGGQLVAVTPRSFCNGPYFKHFRRAFLRDIALDRIHVFEKRDEAFEDDAVLQENVIFRGTRETSKHREVVLSASSRLFSAMATRVVPYEQVVHPDDPDQFIHIATDETVAHTSARMQALPATLNALGLTVSTGRVVDFRAKEYLRQDPTPATWPLIYPGHLRDGRVVWPKLGGKKPNGLLKAEATESLLVPAGTYVVVKRFSSKEERRRVVAAVVDQTSLPHEQYAFENHLNYFHINGAGLPPDLAAGLALFLNSTAFDVYFRQFNGHTQVNATDLRAMRYPTRSLLLELGHVAPPSVAEQSQIDALVERVLYSSPEGNWPDMARHAPVLTEAPQVSRRPSV